MKPKYNVTQDEYNMLLEGKHITTKSAPRKFIEFKYINPSNENDFIWCRVTQIRGLFDNKVAVIKI